ncbi:DUF4189 domain-containing protein [Neisseria sicca]|uniref:PF13827 domain protein n=1 Tax=Neisseria sicca VK64 TaxID=1095748 RepID=I2NSD3_NEISI|nr:DUF4189 domain-containing protein [Neisseria sicca]EIG28744.1 PF13827 domain protein [Neisseria sicca VK64]
MKRLFLIVLGLVSFNVYANGCGGEYQAATGTCRIIDGSGRQILYNVPPPQSGNSTPPPKKIIYYDVKVPSKFGALAFSEKSGHIGGSLNQNSKAEAQNAAIKQCEKGSRNAPCKAISWVRNGCIAAASGKLKNQTRVIGGAAEPGLAEQAAITNCKNAGMTECKVVMPEGCSLPQLQ